MALSRGMNQEASQDTDLGLLDATLMQNLQDRFCDANNVYLVCLSRTRGVVTKAYGSKEELAYIHGLTGVERHMTLMNRLLDDGIESVLEEDCGNDLVKMCGVSIKIGGKNRAALIRTASTRSIWSRKNAGLTITGQESTGSTEEVYFCIPSMR